MKERGRESRMLKFGTIMSVSLMIFCLTFLTTLNFFIYDGESQCVSWSSATEEGDCPPGPTEEKGGTNSITIAEEILHESHPEFDFNLSNQIYLHHIAEAGRIEIFHPERQLPPPKV